MILTWNGLGFDFDVLAEEADSHALCKQCALGHVDMMFHFVCCRQGFPIALDKAAQGMGLEGKPAGMSGAMLKFPDYGPRANSKRFSIMLPKNVRMALQIAQAGDRKRKMQWLTQKGISKSIPLANGWLTVAEAMKLPKPDTSWMAKPLKRENFCGWLLK